MPTIQLCKLNELAIIDTRGFLIEELTPNRNIFVIRDNEQVYAYENQCPHTRAPLDWMPDQFLNIDKEYIQCSGHGALFELSSGRCVYGPCAGQSLRPVQVNIENEWLIATFP
jgi:nitrite reductase/ring-hydroxylating ferredoxin subunit